MAINEKLELSMRKNAFTMIELLTSLAVVAVVTAVLIPSLSKMVPDNSKMKIVNANTQIEGAVNSILNDDSKYNCGAESEANSDLEGLACQSPIPGGTSEQGDKKFENLMADNLGLIVNAGNASFSWKSTKGAFWGFEKRGSRNNAYYIITIDLNGESAPNAVFSATQNNPDRFQFKVSNYGGVVPNDALTEAYLRSSLNSNAKNEDKVLAKKLLSSKKYK